MQLQDIDKSKYRQHLNWVIGICIISLTAGSLGIAQLLIRFFPDADGSHFHWNLLGVIITCVVITLILKKVKYHPFMTEVVYVWELKQALNQVTRKMPRLKKAAVQGDVDAMLAIQFSYTGSRQLWNLDDNTITMEELTMWQAELDSLAKKYDATLDVKQYDEKILQNF
ncbi:DUF3087 domain-containing protein [Pseudoalteromonas luteoviolacea]|uniref:DUF3087 domain-containing protein n=1 Tax=Pseudoalteromonas luteoviolacea S4054 TaxID=1129367 RepID=A0A0F6AIT3_9GAMM|nr:DUF3087 domain-containing protein [Pseudoalteromonas luteoviolacea]AOT07286.1 hypothetical protein S4054249_05220 [Pseudoalteromonas luteoviolacea]AOT12201.1 hypothetical protein S40542_05220 [Pseudoalteromonas luteoviolacea]AOT17114.1 hypothetical protein S4054_05220 [Pseudoalteromonas luteoviolacea]KKE85699.1 hypothetical protein N479_25035 [Pseudoalteromonas luteoviolacea S4054]KZN70962.1 hypothetical protein N481_20480 [Pseudoalteromonas luteoviolacea S4047-1]